VPCGQLPHQHPAQTAAALIRQNESSYIDESYLNITGNNRYPLLSNNDNQSQTLKANTGVIPSADPENSPFLDRSIIPFTNEEEEVLPDVPTHEGQERATTSFKRHQAAGESLTTGRNKIN